MVSKVLTDNTYERLLMVGNPLAEVLVLIACDVFSFKILCALVQEIFCISNAIYLALF